jgi:hypothetical protein
MKKYSGLIIVLFLLSFFTGSFLERKSAHPLDIYDIIALALYIGAAVIIIVYIYHVFKSSRR